MMKDRCHLSAGDMKELCMPERTLWLAVVERALKDYYQFFTAWERKLNVQNYHKKQRMWQEDSPDFEFQALLEFRRLHEFIFDRRVRPNNLEYIADMLYDTKIVENFRKVAKEQFLAHINEMEAKGKFVHIIAKIRDQIADNSTTTNVPLRKFKRFRVESL